MASPIGSYPEIAKAYASSFEAGDRGLRVAGDKYNTGVTVANQRDAASSKLSMLKDMKDPNKYKKVRKEDGGFDFFDPTGKQVDIATYSRNTGIRPSDVLGDSENPIDIQYLRDKDNLQKYIQAYYDKDEETINDYKKNEPRLANIKTPDELIKLFKQSYQRYYVPRTQDPNAWGQNPGESLLRQTPASAAPAGWEQILANLPQAPGGQ